VDTAKFFPSPAQRTATRDSLQWGNSFVWLAVGRLELAKDYPNLLSAFKTAHDAYPTSRLVIAGSGRLEASLRERTHTLGLSKAVEFLGTRTDIPQLLAGCDAFVMSSAWEGAPLALLEASSSGIPVVTTAAGGIQEQVQQDRTGFIVPIKDSAALAGAMTRLMSLPPAALASMGQAGRAHVQEHFSVEAVCQQYGQLYDEVLQQCR
jgi:glycosyltransferase involved in cell wall biosynthesis